MYLIIGPATVEFVRRGGKIRVVCSPSLEFADARSIEGAYADRMARANVCLETEMRELAIAPNGEYRLRVLATLVRCGFLDFRIALRPRSFGLYHEKIGIFKDRHQNAISFIGSSNETWSAWHQDGNFESIEVFCSWNGNHEGSRVSTHIQDFDSLWDGTARDVEIATFPEAALRNLIDQAMPSVDEIDIGRLAGERIAGYQPTRSLQPHQRTALEQWEAMGRRGILEHATGSGKTFTALMALKEHVSHGGAAVVLVPSRLLLEQWTTEIQQEIPNATLLLAGAGHDRWRSGSRLASMTAADDALGARIVLTTMQTAASDDFLKGVTGGEHLMMIADEVHQIGSAFNSRALQIQTGPRLGLSATPKRYGDPVGTARLFDYFGDVVPPPVTLRDAINAGRLVQYEYFPHAVNLTEQEAGDWQAMSKTISQEIARNKSDSDSAFLSERVQLLLIQRARIAKKAANKIPLAVQLLMRLYAPPQRWLVYCDDVEQLRAVRMGLDKVGLQSSEYHSTMGGDREATLRWFKEFGGILVSIRCLDEGVDIPSISHALILASSQNPRQFIQRRGRVLRTAPGKTLAVIHDAIVVPVSLEDEPEQLAVLKGEFARAIQFAGDAINLSAAAELRTIATRIGFDPDDVSDNSIEDDQEWQMT